MERIEFKRSLCCIIDKNSCFDIEYAVSEFLTKNILTVDQYDDYFNYMATVPYVNSILTRREKRHYVYDNFFVVNKYKQQTPIIGTRAVIGGDYSDYINHVYDNVLGVDLKEHITYSLETLIPYLMYLMLPLDGVEFNSRILDFFIKPQSMVQLVSNRNPVMIDVNNTIYNLSSDVLIPSIYTGNWKVVVCEVDYHFYHG